MISRLGVIMCIIDTWTEGRRRKLGGLYSINRNALAAVPESERTGEHNSVRM